MRVAAVTDDDVPSLLLQRVARIRPGEGLDPNFARLLLGGKAFSDYLAPIFTGVSVPHVSPEQIRAFRIPLPPLSEQGEIASRVG
jgi:type I restriction enzyme S subunit